MGLLIWRVAFAPIESRALSLDPPSWAPLFPQMVSAVPENDPLYLATPRTSDVMQHCGVQQVSTIGSNPCRSSRLESGCQKPLYYGELLTRAERVQYSLSSCGGRSERASHQIESGGGNDTNRARQPQGLACQGFNTTVKVSDAQSPEQL